MDRRGRLETLAGAVASGDPYRVARALEISPIALSRQGAEPQPVQNAGTLEDRYGGNWTNVASAWLGACQAAEAGYAVKCYESQSALHTAFHQVFGSSTGNWLVPALHTVCRSTHRIAVRADKEAANGNDQAKLQNAVQLLQESFSRTFNDRKELRPGAPYDAEEGSKKAGVLFIVNELFAIYFRLNTLRLCKNLQKPVETRKLHTQGVMGQMVTYNYYVGRLSLFEDQYAEAESKLEFALSNCHKNAFQNKQRILRYLVPVKLFRGRMPSGQLLTKYKLDEFLPLVDGIRKGDLRTFNDALIQFQDRFIRQGTYLLLEKCKVVCYRNLFRRVHLLLEKHQISLVDVASALKYLGMPADLDEVECILANLIYRGYIRGYLSHAKRVLVLSKRDPFPISAVVKQ